MALQDILNSIQQKLEEELQKVGDDEKKAVEDIKKQMNKEEKDASGELKQQKEQKVSALNQKMDTILKMESRNSMLEAKTGLVSNVFDSVLEELNNLSDGDYKKWAVQAIKEMGLKEGEIIPAKGKEKVIQEAAQEAKSELTVGKAGDFEGGFIARSKNIEIDNTFTSIVFKQLKPELELQVAKILF
jgi:vacuolar-type H+-ATPase subunit E/Vma4